jgi:hypothetical protein
MVSCYVANGCVSFYVFFVSGNIQSPVLSVAKRCDTGAIVAFGKTQAVVLQRNANRVLVPVWTIPRVGNIYKVDLDKENELHNLQQKIL